MREKRLLLTGIAVLGALVLGSITTSTRMLPEAESKQETSNESQEVVKTADDLLAAYAASRDRRDAEAYIRLRAEEAGIHPDTFLLVSIGESGLNAYARGDGSLSRGFWQIYRPSHPNITDACAFDLKCSTDYAIHLWLNTAKGPRNWTCLKVIIGELPLSRCRGLAGRI